MRGVLFFGVWTGEGGRVCAWENSDENRGELSRVSQTLAPPANGGLVRLASSCRPTLVGRPKVRTKERQLRGASTSTMPCSGVWYRSARMAVAAEAEAEAEGGSRGAEAEAGWFPGRGADKQCLDYGYTGEGRIASVVRSRW